MKNNGSRREIWRFFEAVYGRVIIRRAWTFHHIHHIRLPVTLGILTEAINAAKYWRPWALEAWS